MKIFLQTAIKNKIQTLNDHHEQNKYRNNKYS
jgi:hypothetical protein